MTWLNERHKKMIKTVLQIVLVLLILYLLLTKLLLFFAPFIIAFLIACIIEKPAGFMQKRFGFSRGAASAVSIFIFVVLAGGLIGFLFYRLLMEVWELTKISTGYENILLRIRRWIDLGGVWYAALPRERCWQLNPVWTDLKIGDTVTLGINNLLKTMIKVLTSLPQAFCIRSLPLWRLFHQPGQGTDPRFVFSQIPDSWGIKFRSIKNDLFAMTGISRHF